MAQDDQDLELDVDGGAEGEGKGSKKLIIIIIAVVILLGGGAAAFFLMGDSEPEQKEEATDEVVEEKGPAIYIGVPNAIQANLPGARRSTTVQIKLSFMVRSDEAKQNVKLHMPQLKNDILMLLSQQTSKELKTPEGYDKLKQQTLETVQTTLTELVGEPTIEKVLFVHFVMQ